MRTLFFLLRHALLASVFLVLTACSEGVTPPESIIDFGEIYLQGSYEESAPLRNTTVSPMTLSSVSFDEGGAFGLVTALPLEMDPEAEYAMDFSFTTSEGVFGEISDVARVTVTPGTGAPYEVIFFLEALFQDGDLDGDGRVDVALGGDDCNDSDPTIFAGAEELCDGLDNDCDGELPSVESDLDGDGFLGCADDCDDDDSSIHPDADEGCDFVDSDCDGELGEAELDGDGDGFSECDGDCEPLVSSVFPGPQAEECDGFDTNCDGSLPSGETDADSDGWLPCTGDCEDEEPLVNPGRPEEECDGFDTDCDGLIPDDELDEDLDGQVLCQGDCDDLDSTVGAGFPELCDGLDNDCDGLANADAGGELDLDGDLVLSCADCNDTDATINPNATELCDGEDTDCDGTLPVDEGDGDGDGSPACADCNDAEPLQFPGNLELCDGLDNDCDAATDELVDFDGDGIAVCDGDCNDTEASVSPDAPEELCDGLDTDCDGSIPSDEADGDGDGSPACADCDDNDALNFPGNVELCDGLDNDCSGAPDLDAAGEIDADSDGSLSCADCDDDDGGNFPGNIETCDGLDNDCDSSTAASGGEEDGDGDGSIACLDCDDADAANAPGAAEICDGQDNDCSASTDELVDGDGDGFSLCDGDCDDGEISVGPSATELCNGIDDNCDGELALGEDFDSDGDGSLDCSDSDCPQYVDNSSSASPDGSAAAPWPGIQAGLDQLVGGACSTLWVQPGTGSYSEQIAWPGSGEDLRLIAVQGASQTVLDGGGSGPVVTISGGQTISALLQGFTVTGGIAAESGGGVLLDGASATIADCVIDGNSAVEHGGGLAAFGSSPLLLDNTFSNNIGALSGGGVYVETGVPLVSGNVFEDNLAGVDGGGLFVLSGGDDLQVFGNTFTANEAQDDGAGAYFEDFNGQIFQNRFEEGLAADWGGGVVLHTTTGITEFFNNIAIGNESSEGAGLFVFFAEPVVENNSFFDHVATHDIRPSTVRIFDGSYRNNIVAEGTGYGVRIVNIDIFSYNDVSGFSLGNYYSADLTGQDSNISEDPLFVAASEDQDASNDDLHLGTGSPCIDAGIPASGSQDVDGSTNDQGAYGGPFGDW